MKFVAGLDPMKGWVFSLATVSSPLLRHSSIDVRPINHSYVFCSSSSSLLSTRALCTTCLFFYRLCPYSHHDDYFISTLTLLFFLSSPLSLSPSLSIYKPYMLNAGPVHRVRKVADFAWMTT